MRMRKAPDWWRGTRPSRLPVHPGAIHRRGRLSQQSFPTFSQRPADLQALVVTEAYAEGLTISLDDLHFVASWSEFVDCTFTQRRSGPVLNASGAAAQGTLGWAGGPSVYRGCRFEGIRFKRLGGYSMDAATFEGCTFDRCRFNGHHHTTADLIDCRFVGTMDGCTWYGTSAEPVGGRRNVIRGNDFTAATITPNVAWRGNFDVESQRWPGDFTPTVDDQPHP
ncbi:hypothetical protein [Jiangella alba]|uniref:Pentapeptide repeat-containing protein n=1 Tax=Jiangella alba TaxID=561176 RepID=A0A1H5H0K9_9ACTN|nr:hypothetical protein [Jiangella alba]SEE21261.1 hypothetical protein SAMN04488561_0711 [Jiangella alba]